MKTHLIVALCASTLAITACADDNLKVGSRDDIIVKNRGDVSTVAMTEPMIPAMPEAPLQAPVEPPEVMETPEVMAADATIEAEAVTAAAPEVAMDAPTAAVQDVTMSAPITPPEMPGEAPEQIAVPEPVAAPVMEAAANVEKVVTENQAVVNVYAPQQPVVPQAVESTTAQKGLNEVVEEAARISPYIPTY